SNRRRERPIETVRRFRVRPLAGLCEVSAAARLRHGDKAPGVEVNAMKLSRRTVLRGAGVTMALPWLESLNSLAATPAPFPRRFAVLFMGNGINGNHWWARGSGDGMQLGRS